MTPRPMPNELEKARKRVETIREEYNEKQAEIVELEATLKAKRGALDAVRIWMENMEAYAHDVEIGLMDCDHVFEVVVSDRGVGFDQKCTKCNCYGNVRPVF